MIPQVTKRGRPRGSGKNDAPHLRRVAALLVRDPSLKTTTAIKRVIHARRDWQETDATLLRRFQVKWKAHGETLLVQARQAAEYRPPATFRDVLAAIDGGYHNLATMPVPDWLTGSLEKISAFEQRYQKVMCSPEMEAFAQKMTAFDRLVRNATSSPAFLETLKRLTEFDHKFRTALASPAVRDITAKFAEADRQIKALGLNYLSGIPKAP